MTPRKMWMFVLVAGLAGCADKPKPVVDEPEPVVDEPEPVVDEPEPVLEEPKPEVFVPSDEEKADKLKRGMSKTHTTSTKKVLGTDLETAGKLNRGTSAMMKNEYDLAISRFSEVIRLDPKLALAYSNRALAYGHNGEYGKAMADYAEAIRLDPNLVEAYINRAAAYHATGVIPKRGPDRWGVLAQELFPS